MVIEGFVLFYFMVSSDALLFVSDILVYVRNGDFLHC